MHVQRNYTMQRDRAYAKTSITYRLIIYIHSAPAHGETVGTCTLSCIIYVMLVNTASQVTSSYEDAIMMAPMPNVH